MNPPPIKLNTLEKIVLGKCQSFVHMGLWPTDQMNYNKWLSNFTHFEKEHALYLLNSFTYYNKDLIIALLKGVLLELSSMTITCDSVSMQNRKWKEVLAQCLFIPVIGDEGNITDSGNILVHYLRRNLGIQERQIITVQQMYDTRYLGNIKSFKYAVFIDDFVGSGTQFTDMWNDPFEKDSGSYDSVGVKMEMLGLESHYCSLISTSLGAKKIKDSTTVKLHYAHLLLPNASPLHSDNAVWPEHLKDSGCDFILNASKRAGIPDHEAKGFFDLGLTLAFEFTIPDATLPIFRWAKNNWSPLMTKN